jgi:hypothetical protein
MSNGKPKHQIHKPPVPHGAPSNKEGETGKTRIPKKRFWRDWEPMEKFTYVIAIFTVAYSVISLGMYLIAKETMVVSQRAFVYTETVDIANSPHVKIAGLEGRPNSPISAVVTFKNSGQTPATDVSSTISVLFQLGIPKDFGFPEPQGTESTFVAPQTESHDLEIIPADKLSDAEGGKTNLFVYGTISYKDVFGNRS